MYLFYGHAEQPCILQSILVSSALDILLVCEKGDHVVIKLTSA